MHGSEGGKLPPLPPPPPLPTFQLILHAVYNVVQHSQYTIKFNETTLIYYVTGNLKFKIFCPLPPSLTS